MVKNNDINWVSQNPIPSAETIRLQLPTNTQQDVFVQQSRKTLHDIIKSHDNRLAVIVGPCSIHDVTSALEYADKLREQQNRFSEDLFLIMRCYFEKPRTRLGWKGLLYDPHLDGSYDIESGIRLARHLLLQLAQLGVPAGGEFLNSILQLPLQDLMTWYAIGARTSECQLHREIVSGLSIVTGFKNSRQGCIQSAVDAVKVASKGHHFCGINSFGEQAAISTSGNPSCHIILRGGTHGSNFEFSNRQNAISELLHAGLSTGLMVDCSHDNSRGDYRQQISVADSLTREIALGDTHLSGIMLESHLQGGHQPHNYHTTPEYGKSITDACISWEETKPILEKLALSTKTRRKLKQFQSG